VPTEVTLEKLAQLYSLTLETQQVLSMLARFLNRLMCRRVDVLRSNFLFAQCLLTAVDENGFSLAQKHILATQANHKHVE
jgi:hypothetical protein